MTAKLTGDTANLKSASTDFEGTSRFLLRDLPWIGIPCGVPIQRRVHLIWSMD